MATPLYVQESEIIKLLPSFKGYTYAKTSEGQQPRYPFALPGVSVQQDLALVSLLGMTHVERNAHHFIDGMSFAPEAEQRAFVAAHPDLYDKKDGKPARLKAAGGKLTLASLDVPGFAVGADMDFRSMAPMANTVRVRSSYRAVRCAALDPSVALVDGGSEITSTNGSSR